MASWLQLAATRTTHVHLAQPMVSTILFAGACRPRAHHVRPDVRRPVHLAHRAIAQKATMDLADHRRRAAGPDRLRHSQRHRADDEGKPALATGRTLERR